MIEKSGLTVQKVKMLRMDVSQAEEFYKEHYGKSFFGELVEFMTSDQVIGLKLQGKGAIVKWRSLLGNFLIYLWANWRLR